jgi:hypothetical protein
MFNETLNVTKVFLENSLIYLKGDFLNRCLQIIDAPFQNTDMLWMLLPLIATIIFLEFYFGRYKDEELGWNTAYGNALVLLFISIDLFRRTYEPMGKPIKDALLLGDIKILISMVIMAFALLILFIDFFHFLPKKIAYMISSPAYLNFIALLGIIIVYSNAIPLDGTTLGACIVMLLLFTLLAHIIYILVPSYTPPLNRIMEHDGKDAEKEGKPEKSKDARDKEHEKKDKESEKKKKAPTKEGKGEEKDQDADKIPD